MFDMNDPNTFWLNVTNIALGIVTLICCVVVGYGIVQEVLVRVRKRAVQLVESDDHALLVTDLGITMADGGVPVKEQPIVVSEKGLICETKPKQRRRSQSSLCRQTGSLICSRMIFVKESGEVAIRCPFLREAQVKYCQGSAIKKMIVRTENNPDDERCSSGEYVHCPSLKQHHEEYSPGTRCPFLQESLVQYCSASSVVKFIPYSESSIIRCGNDAHRYCDLFLSLAATNDAGAGGASGEGIAS